MPTAEPTHVLTTAAVRWGIDTLGAQKLHPTFVPYLYLRTQERAGTLATASASSRELLALIEMPGHPSKPYYFPLIDRGKRTGVPLPTFWRAPNIPGSWSPVSIGRQQDWLAGAGGGYVLPADHADRALLTMLYGQPVSALAMAAFFLRNDGFVLSGTPDAGDLVTAFRAKFDYPQSTDSEFSKLFTATPPAEEPTWFEAASVPHAGQDDEPSEGASDVR